MITIIAAIAQNNAIGHDNKLLYWLPNDLKRFKALTTGHTIVMGRKTFESLPKGALPNRRNIVLTHQQNIAFEGAETFHSLHEALNHCTTNEEVYIIGGVSIYALAMPCAHKLCITHIMDTPTQADAFFPHIAPKQWKEISSEQHLHDEKHKYDYTFVDYIKTNNPQ